MHKLNMKNPPLLTLQNFQFLIQNPSLLNHVNISILNAPPILNSKPNDCCDETNIKHFYFKLVSHI